MEGLKYMVLFFGGLWLLFWLAGPPTVIKPLTGDTCVEVVNRIWKERHARSPTRAEEIDLKTCSER